jgi:hypothetical protein
MNHFQSSWKTQSGRDIPCEYWEARQGLYRWVALVYPNPYIPFSRKADFLKFLIELGFKVYSFNLEIASGVKGKGLPFAEIENAMRGIANFIKTKEGLPIIPVVESVNAIPFLAAARDSGELYRFAILLAPILN